MTDRLCINCASYRPDAPDDWKIPDWRIAPAVFDLFDLRKYLYDRNLVLTEEGWHGHCHADPRPIEVRSGDWCARWSVSDRMLESWDRFCRDWRERKDMEELRQQLKAERTRSLERYRRIRKLTQKPP